MNIVAILTVRNEAAFLLEWLAHHRVAGITHFVVLSNNCQDGTDTMLDRLAEMGWLTHIRNEGPYAKAGIQFTGLRLADDCEAVKSADWLIALDIDEFVNVHVGDHTLPGLIAALPEASAITLTWRLFGNAEVVRYTDAPVTETFTRCAPEILHWPWRAAMFKTLYRNDGTYRHLGVHRPRGPARGRLAAYRWFDCMGNELDEQFKTRRVFSNYGRPLYHLAQVNHYPLGSMESYVLKADRGRAVHSDQGLGLDYWVERNLNFETDTTIAALAEPSAALRTELRADPTLGPLHRAAVAWRKARFEELMLNERARALFGRLLMTPPSRTVRPAGAQMLMRYAALSREQDQQ
ncbi:glycosyltransferase family 2 protein [Seohaeicola zhoushanensis]|uniref:Glycosyl transferase family 2 n=1 Tax=Seohaeicola zhoushanensis TaxID=1569283 RepID=A0A8J3GW26_9RHOB|nr:glycosyltransferase family 2 protein [Seohaeicola zhoushanensis]GHF41848.1 hypothetical protein GCM10017056_11880 [Seohaeicola zhoushanensis]